MAHLGANPSVRVYNPNSSCWIGIRAFSMFDPLLQAIEAYRFSQYVEPTDNSNALDERDEALLPPGSYFRVC